MLRATLLANGIVDLATGLMLVVLPSLGIRLPGNAPFGPTAAFTAGGWGIAMLALGLGRTWAALVPPYRRMWCVLGVIEGSALALFSVLRVVLTPVTLVEALLPLCVGAVFSILYVVVLTRRPT